MKRFILTLTIAALLAPGLSFAQDTPQPEPQKKTDKLRLFKAGGIGCAAGAGIALLTGKKDKALTACAAGAVVGGVASYRAQVQEAQEVADAAKAAGLDAQVHTKTVEAKDGQAEALDKLVIRYPAADMQPVSAKTGATLDKLVALLKASKEKLTVGFSGADAAVCQVPVVELAKRGALRSATVDDQCGRGDYAITVSPIPDVR
ncbi:hypothetical protein [Stenotrophomonas maltophilia]|uniref:hypothetical protein n=1 Tax=Stenotrophomonas maltophilia TaxID=40324 RepID=UPI002B1D25F7|nr:hypothetical protein [Stenotrophomonas maltophilia]